MPEYTVHMSCEDGGRNTIVITADDVDDVTAAAVEATEEWIRDGEWGDQGACISGGWEITDSENGEPLTGQVEVEIDPDHEALIRDACRGRGHEHCGNSPDDHDWTSEGEGGCRENPGVWSTGGTSMVFASHCRACGLKRLERSTGCQRNPGEHDTVEYTMPDEWCGECESEVCSCPPTGPWIVVRQDTLEGLDVDGEWGDRSNAEEYDDHNAALIAAAEAQEALGAHGRRAGGYLTSRPAGAAVNAPP